MMMENALVLIVEDEPEIVDILETYFGREGFRTVSANDGPTGLAHHLRLRPDIIILDVKMPGQDGYEVLAALRRRGDTPVIMVTALAEDLDKLQALRIGADDYVVKPFSVPELLARVRALLRRSKPERMADTLTLGEIELDRVKRRVSRGGRDIDLGPTEYRLLEYLMERPGRVFTREQLLDGVWGSDVYIDERTVDVHVGRLRKALNRGRETDPIRTVRGSGYSIDDRFGKAS